MSTLSTEQKLKMSLDEIMIEELKEKIEKLETKCDKQKIKNDIPETVKKKRLSEIIQKQQNHSRFRTEKFVGKTVCVLIEKTSKRSEDYWSGRTTQNTVAVFHKKNYQIGDFVDVKITSCTSATLIGDAVKLSNHI